MVGYCSTSKKSAERRCSSRFTSPLCTDAAGMVASTCDCDRSSAITTVPPVSENLPRTLLTIRWRPVNDTPAWPGSMV
jgi:hypothetical protein